MKSWLKKILPDFVFSAYHFLLAFSGALIHGFASRKIKVIGVTGTNGKSTVVFLTSRMLESAGYKVASASSIEFKIGTESRSNMLKMTMPGRFRLQRFIKQAVKADCDYLILEVTSEGIKQSRHRFIDFDSAVFTNLTKEHIESHGSFENYKKAKGKLFEALGQKAKAIVNLDDEHYEYFLNCSSCEIWGYTLEKKDQETKALLSELVEDNKAIHAKDLNLKSNGVDFKVEDTSFELNLLGEFNAYNSLAVISIGLAEGLSLKNIKKGLQEVDSIPGRLEIVFKEPTVIVDYAHTPDSLEKVYQTLDRIKSDDAKLIGVLGSAGGGRDKWKRPELGKIAAKYLDKIILTNEDPYDEDPKLILSEIKSGISDTPHPNPTFDIYEIIDREKAIRKSIEIGNKNDIVIITGKGCEPWMCVEGGEKIEWDDREIVRRLLNH